MPEANEWQTDIPRGSPPPTYKPSARPISTRATPARVTTSEGCTSAVGTPPTPMPTFAWTGISATREHSLTEDVRPGGLGDLDLLVRPQPGQTRPLELELAVKTEDELGRHADLDGEVGGATELVDRLQRGQELGVPGRGGGVEVNAVGARLGHGPAHRHHVATQGLGGLELGHARFLDATVGEQVGRVAEGSVGLEIEAHVGHGAVEEGDDAVEQRLLHAELLEGHERLGRLERVVGVPDLHGVKAQRALHDADALLAAQRDADPARHLPAVEGVGAAVFGEHDLVPGLNPGDAPLVGKQVVQVVDLVGLESGDLRLDGGRLGALHELTPQLVVRELDGVAVAHAGRDRGHRHPLASSSGRLHGRLAGSPLTASRSFRRSQARPSGRASRSGRRP
jgi:hypothetical protein